VSGSAARVIAVTLVNPLELIRTKMQSEKMSYTEVGSAYRSMLKVQGISFLWKGLFPTILRDVPFSGESFKLICYSLVVNVNLSRHLLVVV
jgi:solute carrier family 25, member 39/40